MFTGFSEEAIAFLRDIRIHDDKDWFETHKKTYTDKLYHPMKELCAEVAAPFSKKYFMMSKTGRIYTDPNYPPYRKYRDNMWFVVRHEAWDWSKTPSLFFDLTGDGAVLGFKITHPAAPVMEKFRQRIVSDGGEFFKLVKKLERAGMVIVGDEYKRQKPCESDEARRFYQKKALSITMTLPADSDILYKPELAKYIGKVFRQLLPVNDMFDEFALQADAEKLAAKAAASEPSAPEMPKAPDRDFMW